MANQYLFTDEQKDLQLMVRDFVNKEIIPHAAEWDVKGEFPQDTFRKACDMGLHLMGIPEEFGGMGLDQTTSCILREELGRGDAGFAVSLGANMLGYTPLSIAGTKEQIKHFADIVVPGAVSAFCLTEAQGGSDAGNSKTTAVKVGDEYVINGVKTFITNGGIASVYTVFAMTDKEKGVKGMSAFLVERDRPGVSVGAEENKMGIRASNTTEVVFEDVHVPADHLIGKEGDGFKIAMKTLDRTRPSGSATAVGICQRAIDECVKYAKERVVFGKPIAKHQAVAFMLADMEIQTQAARQMVMHAARLMDNGIYDSVVAAAAKTFTGDTAMKVTTDAVQVLGGFGYSREYPVEKLMRDAKIYQIFEGTNQIQRVVISGNLLR
ncbi:acyl-CoA dehydrogenase family protein [uncultured Intestinimonas sp.]|uniref:acyl-CoA dehydrogenase family protein n=1 Tax=uncultured Intestinimonas sp. TaxID=1689265 RepID=UPI0025D9557D|nr:acyl-CoA dehydrogenase family protein [uncultured Intestinimonas sp.]